MLKRWTSSKGNEQPKETISPHLGLIDDLDETQKNTLQLFQSNYAHLSKNNRFDDATLFLRYLRARQFDMALTTKMFEEDLKWRQSTEVEVLAGKIYPFAKEVYTKYPHGYHGVDKKGRPVYIDRIGKADTSAILKSVSAEEMCNLFVQEYECLLEVILPCCSEAAGQTVEQTTTIVDLEGLGFSHMNSKTRDLFKRLSTISQDHFPETLGHMIVVNAPAAFSAIWSFAKSLIDERTSAKITVFSSRSTSWKAKLLETINADQLPEFLGGTKSAENWPTSATGPWTNPEILSKVARKRPHARQTILTFAATHGIQFDAQNIPLDNVKRENSLDTSVSPLMESSTTPGSPKA